MITGPEYRSEWPETVSHRIADVSLQNPNSVAVKDGFGCALSYEQLQRRVQHISNSLAHAGVRGGSRVAVFQEPSADWICSLLAVWHAGATYIPLDLRVTESLSRLALIARTARPTAILCHGATASKVADLDTPSAAVVNVSALDLDADVPLTPTKAKSTTAAAILFTSGSTGIPKGVILPHRALQNTFEGLTREYQIGAEKVLQQSAFTFDFSLDQIVCGLAHGGSVYVVSKEQRSDPGAIARLIDNESITYTRATPSEYTSWLAHGLDRLVWSLTWKFAFAGGETLPRSLVDALANLALPRLNLYNSYGPAESITCTKTLIPLSATPNPNPADHDEETKPLPVGRPLPNYHLLIASPHSLALLPPTAAGEILIAGPSVAAGYLHDAHLSETRFISNPFPSSSAGGGGVGGRIVYRTGDVGRLRPDGSLQFVGRLAGDTQVKLRGMRVDLREVEGAVVAAAEGAVLRVVVTVRGRGRGEVLVAHVQFAEGEGEEEEDEEGREVLRMAFLRQLRAVVPLPVYMVPAVFVVVDEMPMNAHGKVDRAAVARLPLPEAAAATAGGRAGEALTEMEGGLLEVWKQVVVEGDGAGEDVLAAVQVTSLTSFFELGGNSLLLVKLQMLIASRFGVRVSLVDLFGAADLGSMAAKIQSAPPVASGEAISWEEELGLKREK
jgi:hybrid polyketide synthase/nonribosomal peptide synthetase ACE1